MLSVRELEPGDIPLLLDYWFNASPPFLRDMGVDLNKMPSRQQFNDMLLTQLALPVEKRQSYCLVWLADNQPVGHSNTNPTVFGVEGKMHLHLWQADERKRGLGTSFVKLCLPVFFERLQLKTIWCEPYALNPAPNKTLEKTGFTLIKEYVTTPGSINFEQPVKQWRITAVEFNHLSI